MCIRDRCKTLWRQVLEFTAGITRCMSSAYLKMWFPAVTGCKSAAVTRYEVGPRPEPCMTLALTWGLLNTVLRILRRERFVGNVRNGLIILVGYWVMCFIGILCVTTAELNDASCDFFATAKLFCPVIMDTVISVRCRLRTVHQIKS